MNRNTIEYPQPYKVMNGWLYREMQSSRGAYDKPLCNFLPYIVREVTLDDGAETSKRLLLSGVKCTGEPLPEVEISGTELSSFNWVMEHWGADCVLEVGSNVKDHVRYAIQQTAADAERSTVYTVTGWKKIDGAWHYLLPGDQDVTVQLPDKLSGYRRGKAVETQSCQAVAQMLLRPPGPKNVCYILFAFTFLSPLNTFLHMIDHEPKFVLLLTGRTGTRKSTLAALFLSFFGHFTASDLPLSFRDTANSITQNAFALKDVLTCIDDYHPSGRQEEVKLTATAQTILRAYGDRTGRGRLRADSTQMPSRPPQGNAIITAEFPPDVGESGTARTFPIELQSGDVDLKLLTRYQRLATDGILQNFMLAYTEWIRLCFLNSALEEKKSLDALRDVFTNCCAEFEEAVPECHGRLPEMVSWLRLGMLMLLYFLETIGALTAEQAASINSEFISLLNEQARRHIRSVESDKPAVIFLRKLYALIESGKVSLLKKDDPRPCLPPDFIGYEDAEHFYLQNDAAHRAVRKLCEDQGEMFTISSRSLPKALAEEGVALSQDGKNTRTVRFGKRTTRVIVLSKTRAAAILGMDAA